MLSKQRNIEPRATEKLDQGVQWCKRSMRAHTHPTWPLRSKFHKMARFRPIYPQRRRMPIFRTLWYFCVNCSIQLCTTHSSDCWERCDSGNDAKLQWVSISSISQLLLVAVEGSNQPSASSANLFHPLFMCLIYQRKVKALLRFHSLVISFAARPFDSYRRCFSQSSSAHSTTLLRSTILFVYFKLFSPSLRSLVHFSSDLFITFNYGCCCRGCVRTVPAALDALWMGSKFCCFSEACAASFFWRLNGIDSSRDLSRDVHEIKICDYEAKHQENGRFGIASGVRGSTVHFED